MLHYSNASSIEMSRRYLVNKGGLAWLLWQEGVVNTIVDQGYRQRSRGLPEKSNSLPNSIASSVQKRRQYLVIKGGGGLAWLLWEGGVIFGVVEHTDIGTGLRVYRKEVTKGEHNK